MKPKFLPFIFLLGLATSAAADVTLYDSSLGTTPGNQGWIAVIGGAGESMSGGFLQLDTTANESDQAGYFSESPWDGLAEHPLMPMLDLNQGFTIRFDLQILAETHQNRDDNGDGKFDRAGFSLIAISENLDGLELAFFEDRIWAYADATEGTNSLFTQAEGVAFDTTAAITTYDLVFSSNGYEFFADGNSVLSGDVRNYNPSGVPALLNPYDNPSFLFFGDNTTSAASNSRIGRVQVLAAIPEPATTLPLLITIGLMTSKRAKRRLA